MRRPVTALDCVVLKDRNLSLAHRQGPEISSRACLWVSPRPRHHTQCWLTNQSLILLCISCLETPKAGSGPTNFRAGPPLQIVGDFLSSYPRCSWNQYSPTALPVDIIQSLLVLLDQWRRSDGLKHFQSRLTIRANTHIFLWSILKLDFLNTSQESIYISA